LEPEEGEAQLARLAARRDVAVVPFTRADVPAALHEAIQAEGSLRVLPHHLAEHGGVDGFFIARVKRV
jgi:16S rRNA (cytosine967-C5)-methyltransferase